MGMSTVHPNDPHGTLFFFGINILPMSSATSASSGVSQCSVRSDVHVAVIIMFENSETMCVWTYSIYCEALFCSNFIIT
nr:Biomphalaria glabrata F-box/LRR-repeat protein 15-like [Biomphalaria glabrata]